MIENTYLGFLIRYEENVCSEFDLFLKKARSSNQVLGLVHPIRKLVQTHVSISTNVMVNTHFPLTGKTLASILNLAVMCTSILTELFLV